MSTYPLPPDEQPRPPEPVPHEPQPGERPQDDDWQPYRPTPLPAPVFPQAGPLDPPREQPGRPPPGHHIPQRDDRRPYAAPQLQQPPPQQQGPPPFPGPFAPGPGHHIPYGAPPPPPAFAPPVDGPQPPPPAFAPPVSGPQPPPPQQGLGPPRAQPQFQSPYEPRPKRQRQPAAETAADLPPVPPGLRRRRLIELGALLVLAPVVIGVRWYDDRNHAVTQEPHERVTVVSRGAWAKLGHTQWRMLGRQDRAAPTSDPDATPGAATLVLLLQAKVLDAQGVKELGQMDYEIRDRAGHIWSTEGAVENQSIDDEKPTPGSTQRVKVIATVPRSKLNEVVLDLHIQPNVRAERTVLDVLRFAH